MKSLLLLVLFLFTFVANADVYVRGYRKSNGTYVKSHYRSNPNRTVRDNWSTSGNTNPYTGRLGTRKARSRSGYSNTTNSIYSGSTNSIYSGSTNSLWGN